MSFGLLIKDASQRTVMDPDTFTVRLVDRFTVSQGAGTYARPKVKPGMFCTFQSQNNGVEWIPPVGTVGEGTVYIRGTITVGGFTNGVDCLVLAYV
jgi:hypothetical protein